MPQRDSNARSTGLEADVVTTTPRRPGTTKITKHKQKLDRYVTCVCLSNIIFSIDSDKMKSDKIKSNKIPSVEYVVAKINLSK
jgi:hypothetical protein